jgi:hypothetical protein
MSANNSSTHLNQTIDYPTLDSLFTMVGSTTYLDSMWLYVNVPVNAIGVIFNLLALLVLLDKEFAIPLYDYLRVYCANSFVLNLFTLFMFAANTPRIFAFSNTGDAERFFLYALVTTNNVVYFYGTALDILITFDRIGTFKPKAIKWLKLSPYKTCLIIFVVCLVIDFPYLFVFVPCSLTVKVNATFLETVWYPCTSEYANSELGTIVTFIIYAIRDILLTVAEIALNVASVYFLKEYMSRRAKLLNNKPAVTANTAVPAERLSPVNHKVTKTGNEVTAHETGTTQKTGTAHKTGTARQTTAVEQVRSERVSKADQRLCVMVLIMCLLSIIEHFVYLAAATYPYLGADAVMFHTLYYFCFFFISLKHTTNFFLFFGFNNKFRAICLKFVGRSQH